MDSNLPACMEVECLQREHEYLQEECDKDQVENVRLPVELKYRTPVEDSLIHKTDKWMKREVELWNCCWNSFKFMALEERFRKRGLTLLGELFEQFIHRELLHLPTDTRRPLCGTGTLT